MSIHTQVVRLGTGSDGTNTALVSSDNPIPVSLPAGNLTVSGPLTDLQLRTAPVLVTGGQITVTTATIAEGAAISDDIDLGTAHLGCIVLPDDWTAADLTLQVSHDGTVFRPLYDSLGTEFAMKAAAARAVLVPSGLPVQHLRICSGTVDAPVVQAANRSLALVVSGGMLPPPPVAASEFWIFIYDASNASHYDAQTYTWVSDSYVHPYGEFSSGSRNGQYAGPEVIQLRRMAVVRNAAGAVVSAEPDLSVATGEAVSLTVTAGFATAPVWPDPVTASLTHITGNEWSAQVNPPTWDASDMENRPYFEGSFPGGILVISAGGPLKLVCTLSGGGGYLQTAWEYQWTA